MGFIKAGIGAVSGTLKDQFKNAIRCDEMGNDILMVKRTPKTKVIANGSSIIVGPGQMAIIYDNGEVIDAVAEEGFYTYDASSSPSFFSGSFGPVLREMWQRFTYNGVSAKQQAVFFFNIKEIVDNKFGTPTPIPYRDFEHPVLNPRTGQLSPMRLDVRCFGKYSFKLVNPAMFMRNVAGVADIYRKDEITEQIRSEVVAAFTNVLNGLGQESYKIGALSLPSQSTLIKSLMVENVYDEPIRNRGLAIVGFIVESVTLDAESKKKIDSYELGGDVYQQQGTLVNAYGQAIQDAAKNSGGAGTGFMNIGMMNMATGNAFGNATGNNVQQQMNTVENENQQSGDAKFCSECGAPITGKFCSRCGKQTGK